MENTTTPGSGTKKNRSLAFEVLTILAVSIIVGLIANFLSPKGIALIRDDSERFAIDTAGTNSGEKKTEAKQLTKEGFVKPVNIPVATAKELFDKGVIFIDGRDAHEFVTGHIKGAINIPYHDFMTKSKEEKLAIMKDIGLDKTIVSYCGGGECEISIDNAYEMAKAGYTDVKIYLGGYMEWEKLNYPVEK